MRLFDAMKEFMNGVLGFVDRMIRQEAQHKCTLRTLHVEQFPVGEFHALNVNTEALDVKFKCAEDSACVLSIETDDSRDNLQCVSFVAKLDNGVLDIRSSENQFHGAVLVVRLPRGLEAVGVNTTDGDVSITGCDVRRVAIATVSADICANGIGCDAIKLYSLNGDISALNIKSNAKVCVKSVNGDVVR